MSKLALYIVTGILLYGCLGCQPTSSKSQSGPIEVVSTIGMIKDIVQKVGESEVNSVGLMGPGVDPHLYRATAGDVSKLSKAEIIFYGGLELEGRMTDIFVKMASKGKITVPVTEGIPENLLREPPEFGGKHDPHVWFDVTLWKHAVTSVKNGLSKVRPNNKQEFEANAARYTKELDNLDQYIRDQVKLIPPDQRVLITAHDAFGYFGQQYGFEVVAIQGTSTVTEAAAGNIRQLADKIASKKIKAIFVESSVPKATIEALQKAVQSRGWNVAIGGELFSDAMGSDGTPEGSYIGMVRHNIDAIVKALK